MRDYHLSATVWRRQITAAAVEHFPHEQPRHPWEHDGIDERQKEWHNTPEDRCANVRDAQRVILR